MIRLLRIVAVTALLAIACGTAATAAPDALIEKSLIYLELTYTPTTGAMAGVPQTEQATGFLVSEDGFILTSYHLLEGYDAAKGSNITLRASLGEPGSPFQFEGAIVNALKPLDLLLLKIRPSNQVRYEPARLGRSEQIGDQEIFTSGFHGSEPFAVQGRVSNRLGPVGVGYLWAVDMMVTAGQSGSPVYLADGTVVGMLKGNNRTAPEVGYMIPIEYADALIAHLRMAAMEAKIARLEASMRDVGAYYVWTGEYRAGRLVISYAKLIAGDPHIKDIDYSIDPFITFEDGQTTRNSVLDRGTVEATVAPGGKGGEMVIDHVDEIMALRLKSSPTATAIPRLDVKITPVTSDGTKLAATVVRIEVPPPL